MGVFSVELEKINNSFLSEKNQRRKEKQEKERLKEKLFNYFYKEFKKKEEEFENIYNKLNYIKERERIISLIGENKNFNFQFLNAIYNKTLQEVYKIFKNNYKFIEEQNNKAIEGAPPSSPYDLKFLTLELKHELKQKELLKLAKELGFDTEKTLTIEEINLLTEKINQQTEEIKGQQEEQKQEKKWKIIANIFNIFICLLPFIFIIGLLVAGYFKFALPILN